mgnify:CR=1 FL=1
MQMWGNTEEEIKRELIKWREAIRKFGLEMNSEKTKILILKRDGDVTKKVKIEGK